MMNGNLVFLVEYNDYDIHEVCSAHSTVHTFKIVSFDNSIIVASFVSEEDCMAKAKQECIKILLASGAKS
jgi:hypothetical protein